MSLRDDIDAIRAAGRGETLRRHDAGEDISLAFVASIQWEAIYALADAIDESRRDEPNP